ncbi:hypothetical protein B0H19DRAFT_1288664 [Mycena capillaripes]|nr:hypothetical protein B0H19DRAFT_1288664 [Mycena capillaripes]
MPVTSPRRRTRVFLACLHCRRRKIKCLTDDAEQKPCERCVQKALLCEYHPVADKQKHSTERSGVRYSSGPQPQASPPASQACSPYLVGGNHRAGHLNAQYLPSISYILPSPLDVAGQSPNVASPQVYTGFNSHPIVTQGYNAHRPPPPNEYGTAVPTLQQRRFFGHPRSYGYPSNWPQFPESSTQPYAFPFPTSVLLTNTLTASYTTRSWWMPKANDIPTEFS